MQLVLRINPVHRALKAGIIYSVAVSATTMVLLLSTQPHRVGVHTINGHVATCSAPTEFCRPVRNDRRRANVGPLSMRAYKKQSSVYRLDGGALLDCLLSAITSIISSDNAFDGAAGFWVGIIVGVGGPRA